MKGKRSTAGGFEGNWSGSSRGGKKGKTAVVAAPVAVYGLGWRAASGGLAPPPGWAAAAAASRAVSARSAAAESISHPFLSAMFFPPSSAVNVAVAYEVARVVDAREDLA